MNTLEISPEINIPLSELTFTFIRSGGAGGQHVNKTSTQVELRFSLLDSPSIPESDKSWLKKKLSTKLTSSGELLMTSQTYRSQSRNRTEVTERFVELMREALVRPKPRKRTKPSRAQQRARIESKKKRGELKKVRSEKF